jgi:hypothetical protein
MLLNGEWTRDPDFEPEKFYMKFGQYLLGTVQPGRDNDTGYWVATVNDRRLGEHPDREWAFGVVEAEFVNEIWRIRHVYHSLKRRAPTSMDLYGCGGWEKFKARQESGG